MILDRFIPRLDWLPFGKSPSAEPDSAVVSAEESEEALDLIDRFESSANNQDTSKELLLKSAREWAHQEDAKLSELSFRVLAQHKREIADPLERATLLNGEQEGARLVLSLFSVQSSGYDLRADYAEEALSQLKATAPDKVSEESVRTVARFTSRAAYTSELLDRKQDHKWRKKGERLLQQWWKSGSFTVERDGQLVAPGSSELGSWLHQTGFKVQGNRILIGRDNFRPSAPALKEAKELSEFCSYPNHPKGVASLETLAGNQPDLATEVIDTLLSRPDLLERSSRYALSQILGETAPDSPLQPILDSRSEQIYETCVEALVDSQDSGAMWLSKAMLRHREPPTGWAHSMLEAIVTSPDRHIRDQAPEWLDELHKTFPEKHGEACQALLERPMHQSLSNHLTKRLKTAAASGWRPQDKTLRKRLQYRLGQGGDAISELKLEFQGRHLKGLDTPQQRMDLMNSFEPPTQRQLLELWTELASSEDERDRIKELLAGSNGEATPDLDFQFEQDFVQIGDFALPVGDTGLPF